MKIKLIIEENDGKITHQQMQYPHCLGHYSLDDLKRDLFYLLEQAWWGDMYKYIRPSDEEKESREAENDANIMEIIDKNG
jgi:hypothetical protein